MIINQDKTEDTEFTIGNNKVEIVDEFKHLGINNCTAKWQKKKQQQMEDAKPTTAVEGSRC